MREVECFIINLCSLQNLQNKCARLKGIRYRAVACLQSLHACVFFSLKINAKFRVTSI